jgi:hypothetical protein
MWDSISDKELIMNSARNTVNGSNVAAYSLDLGYRFLNQNYPCVEQDVFQSFRANSYAEVKAVSTKYEPDSIFANLQLGISSFAEN